MINVVCSKKQECHYSGCLGKTTNLVFTLLAHMHWLAHQMLVKFSAGCRDHESELSPEAVSDFDDWHVILKCLNGTWVFPKIGVKL